MKALGCHVFAGGFTMGVREVADVSAQLEIHDFGRDTVEQRLGVEFINRERWQDWPEIKADVIFGNPRCTGFSSLSSLGDETVHGPDAHCTQDIRDLCSYGVQQRIPVVIWESVQMAMTVGRKLLNTLRDEWFLPNGYRVAHVLMNAAAFGSAQRRKRYMFVAYRRDLTFNVEAPPMLERHVTIRDVIGHMEGRQTYPMEKKSSEYGSDHYKALKLDDQAAVQALLPGHTFNSMFKHGLGHLMPPSHRQKWDDGYSTIPFSLHCPHRLEYDGTCPTMTGSCQSIVHPVLHRTLTVGELSALMGWPDGIIPAGPDPGAQLAKGICPHIGTWIAEQARACLEGRWDGDWESRWDGEKFVGREFTEPPDEKVFNLTEYAPCPPEATTSDALTTA